MDARDREYLDGRFDRLEDKLEDKIVRMDERLRHVESHAHVGSVLGSIGALIASGILVHLITAGH